MYVDKAKTYIGVVESNKDPQRVGRCKIRVLDIFDDIPTEDIPWASPWKDLNGNTFNLPDIGKVVTVIFDSGNIYKPEYIYAEHFNTNLEEKLRNLSEKGYSSMKALMFDDKTQIFSNDDDGLMMDYKYNNINITNSEINVNLKDIFGTVNLGDAKADQSAILGTTFLEWFDQFVNSLVGESPYHGNLGAPVFASPALVEVCKKYFLLRESKFLSKNVFLNSNFKVSSVINKIGRRPTANVQGDTYNSSTPFSTYTQTTTTDAPTAPVDIRPPAPVETRPSDTTSRLDIQGAKDITNYGKLVVSSNKTSPTLICFGGIDVKGKESGEYMWDYFGQLKNKFQIFVAKNDKVDGEKSYDSVIKYLSDNGYNTSEQILYLFSGGYLPGISVLTKFGDKFKKVILVDIWMGDFSVASFYSNFVGPNKNKIYYIYTNFGANNSQASDAISKIAKYKKLKSGLSMQDHMDCNKLAIDILIPEEIKTSTVTPPTSTITPPGSDGNSNTPPPKPIDIGPIDPNLANVDYSFVEFADKVLPGSEPSVDYAEGKLNYSLLADIAIAAKASKVKVSMTTAIRGHRDSARHNLGVAMDICQINGKGYHTEQDAKDKGIYEDIMRFVGALQQLGYVKNSEKNMDKAVLTFGFPDHQHHVHVSRKSGQEFKAPGLILSRKQKKEKGLPPF